MDLLTAIHSLDPERDEHWTDNGAPKLSAVKALTGNDELKRSEISAAAPGVTREALAAERGLESGVAAAEASEPTPEPAPEPRDVLSLPVYEVFQDYKLCREARDELNARSMDAMQRRAEIQREIDRYSAQTEAIERAIVRHERAQPKLASDPGIRAYLDRQAQVRAERAERARAFINSHTNAQDVAKELAGSSPLDSALKARPKQGRGRPEPRIPAHRR